MLKESQLSKASKLVLEALQAVGNEQTASLYDAFLPLTFLVFELPVPGVPCCCLDRSHADRLLRS